MWYMGRADPRRSSVRATRSPSVQRSTTPATASAISPQSSPRAEPSRLPWRRTGGRPSNGASPPSTARSTTPTVISSGALVRWYPPVEPRLEVSSPARLSASSTCSRYRCGIACRVAISWIGTSGRPRFMARSSIALIAYSPFAEMRMRSAPVGPALEQTRGVFGEVGDDDVGPGPPDARERLHDCALLVEPAELASRADHRVLPRHGVGGQRHAELRLGPRDHVEVGQGRLHHHDVGALVEVERDLSHGLLGIGRIHLIGAPVAE